MARKAGTYAKCIGKHLKGRMKGKSVTERRRLFKDAARKCKRV